MRSLTLARALAERGARPAFLAPPDVARILDRYAPDMARLPAPDRSPTDLVDAATAAPGFDAVIFDHYRMGADEHAEVAHGRPTVVLDDLADRPLAADLVIDFGAARAAEDYAGLLPEGATLALGLGFAPVRPEFVEARAGALARRGGPNVGRVLVTLGMTDVGAVTRRVVDRVLPRLGDAALDVVLGADAPSRAAVEALAARDPRIALHLDVQDMARLMTAADLAIGAGGATTWERCALGLPTVNLILAENQEPGALALDRLGAVATVDARADDFEAQFDRAFTGLLRSPERRARMSRIAADLCDGRGAGRAAGAVLAMLARRSG